MNISKRFMTGGTRVLLFAPFLFLLSAVLITPPLHAFPVDKGSPATAKSFKDLPPGAAMAMAKAMLKELPEEYQLTAEGRGYSQSNPAHDMDIDFTPDGLQVMTGGKSWGMALTGIGTRSSVRPVQKAVLMNDHGRMVYARGDVVEWYVNTPWGMEQGFTIRKAPGERSRDGLVVELTLSGDVLPSLDSDTLVLADAQGNSIARYTGLQVFDADGRSLPAQLTLAGSTLRILVDDVHAQYPVTIDPWIQRAKLTPSDGAAGDWFGTSVATSGDKIVVGADYNDISAGSAYVFARPGSGWANMTQTAKLIAADGTQNDGFGTSVAISGDTVVIGAYHDDSAYVFVKPSSGWANMTQTAKLTASDGGESEGFGYSVAISGDTVVVGAYSDDDKGAGSGSAYVFVKPSSGWANMTQTAKLTASDGAVYDFFGFSVAISGDTVVAGARGNANSAYVFVKPGSGWANMTQTAKLTSSDGAAGDLFGFSVTISGDTIVAGAPDDNYDHGSAYVFAKPSSGWGNMTQTAILTTPGGGAECNEFGRSVAISGGTVVVGAWSSYTYSGAAYVFVKPSSGWANMTQTAILTAGDWAKHSFGKSVAISGDTIVAGAPFGDDDFGSAYVFKPPSVIKREQWELILDKGQGRASLTLLKKDDGTITADGDWEYTYQGSNNFGTYTEAPVTISGKFIALTATGTATNLSAPPGYTTSPFTSVFSGTAFDGEGSGTYSVTFQAYGWPDKLSGSWTGTRTSGSGITAEGQKALPWIMLLLGD